MMRLWQNGPSICLSQMVHACILYSVFDIILTIDADGSKVVAQTPEGTRVATPNPMRDQNPSTSSSSASSAAKQSYASALKNKASDWHLEFSMDDHVLPLDMTLATVRQYLWHQSGELVMHYRRKTLVGGPHRLSFLGSQGLAHAVEQQAMPSPM